MVDKTKVYDKEIISWPSMADMTSTDCHRLLRQCELEAYSKIVSAFRAQGLYTKEKMYVLTEIRRLLKISGDRHRAEIRRAVNDDTLALISKCICGKSVDERWCYEGRRVVPVLNRSVPETAFLADADAVANKIASFKIKKERDQECFSNGTDISQNVEKFKSISIDELTEPDSKSNSNEKAMDSSITLTELIESVSTSETAETPVVPEAAVEVTCEADSSLKPKAPSVSEEKASLITEMPSEKLSKDKEETSQHNPPTLVKQLSLIQPVLTGMKRPHAVIDLPASSRSSPSSVSPVDVISDKNGIPVPVMSATRNFLIRPNANTTPKSLPPQGNNGNRIQSSSTPLIPIPIINRSNHSSSMVSAPSLTTYVMSGSAGPTAYVNNASRVYKSYSSATNAPAVISANQQAQQQQQKNATIIASASENKKVPLSHSIIIQSYQPTAPKPLQMANSSTSRSVYFLPQGQTNRFMTSGSLLGNASQSPVPSTPSSLSSPSTNRPLRILPVNSSLITTSTAAAGGTGNHGPLITSTNLPSNYPQNNARVSNDSEVSSPTGTNLMKLAPLLSTGGSSLLVNSSNINISQPALTPMTGGGGGQQSSTNSSSQLISMLDPKRPRLAFMPTAASPSTRH